MHLHQLNRRYQRLSSEKKLPQISRRPFRDDEEVVDWIIGAITRHALDSPSKSSLLRLLRDEGRACEQKRFGVLFEEALAHSSLVAKSAPRRR
jgi:hypothetical protein